MMETWTNEKWPDSGSTLKKEPKGFADGLDMFLKEESRMTLIFLI